MEMEKKGASSALQRSLSAVTYWSVPAPLMVSAPTIMVGWILRLTKPRPCSSWQLRRVRVRPAPALVGPEHGGHRGRAARGGGLRRRRRRAVRPRRRVPLRRRALRAPHPPPLPHYPRLRLGRPRPRRRRQQVPALRHQDPPPPASGRRRRHGRLAARAVGRCLTGSPFHRPFDLSAVKILVLSCSFPVTRLLLFFPCKSPSPVVLSASSSLACISRNVQIGGVLFFPPPDFLCNFLLERKGICLSILTACIISCGCN